MLKPNCLLSKRSKKNKKLKTATRAVHLHGMSCHCDHCVSQIFEDPSVPDEGLSQWRAELSPLVLCIPIVLGFPAFVTNLEMSIYFLPVAGPVSLSGGLAKLQSVQSNNLIGSVSREHRARMRNLQ